MSTNPDLAFKNREIAFKHASELLRNGVVEYSTEDILIVADWLLTGVADLALKFSAQMSDNYKQLHKDEED